jgi:hypothetical protein
MKSKLLVMGIAGALIIGTFESCKKKTDTVVANSADTDTQTAQDQAYAESTYNDAYASVNDAASIHGELGKTGGETVILQSNASITVSDIRTFPIKVTIDFGTGTTCKDNKVRSGQIIATLSGKYRDSGTVITITFNGYTVNGDKVEGVKTVTNEGHNANGNLHYAISVDGKVTRKNGNVILYKSSRDREWIQGSSTPGLGDDMYSITGSASGTSSNGNIYSLTITKPLIVAFACRFIEAGTVDIAITGKADRIVNYGDTANCDANATVTINGKVYNIVM